MSSLTLIQQATKPPMSIKLVKNHLRLPDSKDDDELVALYAKAACELAENESGRSFVNKQFLQTHDHFPRMHDWTDRGTGYWYAAPRYARQHYDIRQEIKLLRSPLVSIDRIIYLDASGTPQTLYPTPELWQPDTIYFKGDLVEDQNGNLQKITAVDDSKGVDGLFQSGSSAPTWSSATNGTAADGPFTWTYQGVAPAGDFLVDRQSEPARITPLFGEIWPQTQLKIPNAVKIYFTSGYGDTGFAVPAMAKVLMLQLIAHWNENREAVTDETLKTIPKHLENLAWQIRVEDYSPTH